MSLSVLVKVCLHDFSPENPLSGVRETRTRVRDRRKKSTSAGCRTHQLKTRSPEDPDTDTDMSECKHTLGLVLVELRYRVS